MLCYTLAMHMLFQPRPFTPFQLSWYLFIMTIDTTLLCLCKFIYIAQNLPWVLTTATDEHIYLVWVTCFSVYTFNQWVVSEWICIGRLCKMHLRLFVATKLTE